MNYKERMVIYIFALVVCFISASIMIYFGNKEKKSDGDILIDSLKYEIFIRDSVLYLEGQYIYRIRQIYGVPDSIPFEPRLMNKYPPKVKRHEKE